MAKFADRVKVGNTTAANAGSATTLTLGSAEAGYQAVPSSLNGETIRYVIEEGNTWEIGTGTYTHSGTTLTRSVTSSSNSNNAIAVTTNSKVFIAPVVDDLQFVQVYSSTSDLPSASDNHGRITHVHGEGAMYFAHGGSWVKLANASDAISLTDLSVTQNAASGSGALTYNSSTGVFSYTPPTSTSSSGGTLEPVKETEFTATANQTTFTVTYAVGNIAVFLNGSKLGAADFTATNGTTVVLATGATLNDLVEVVEYGAPFASPYSSSIHTATANQTSLTVAYTVGKVAVYVNGVKYLVGTDVTATNGTSLTFTSALSAGDKIEVVEHGALADAASAFTDLTDTPSSLGTAGQVVQVNSAGNALEFADAGVANQGTLTKTFTQNEEATITLSNAVSPVPMVSVFKEIPQVGVSSKGNWDVNSTGSNYDRFDEAPVSFSGATLTPSSATADGTFTLSSGSFASGDVGKTVEGNSGKAIITATTGTYSLVTAFANTNAISSGSWALYGVVPNSDGSGLTLSSYVPPAWDLGNAAYNNVNYSPNTQTGNSIIGMAVSTDGTKMYTSHSSTIYQYSITGGDISTASYDSKSYTPSQQNSITSISFNPNGTKMYVAGQTSNTIYQYTLNPAWDVSSASYDNASVALGGGTLYGHCFNDDGSKLYLSRAATSTNVGVYPYSLTQNYDISSATSDGTRLNTHSQTGNYCRGIAFNGDGSKFFVIGNANSNYHVFQYNTTADYDLTTASYANISFQLQPNNTWDLYFSSDGSIMYTSDNGGSPKLYQYFSGVASTFPTSQYLPAVTNTGGRIDSTYWTDINSMTADEAAGNGAVNYAVSTDGRTTWLVNKGTDGVRKIAKNNSGTWQYNNDGGSQATSYYDFANASYSTISPELSQNEGYRYLYFKPDGTKVWVGGIVQDTIYEYDLNPAWDLSTISYGRSKSFSTASMAMAFYFRSNGTRAYLGQYHGTLYQLNLTTAWNISSTQSTYQSLSLGTTTQGVFFKPDGAKFYSIDGSTGRTIKQFGMTSDWDITTASVDHTVTIPTDQGVTSGGTLLQGNDIWFSSDGTKFFCPHWNGGSNSNIPKGVAKYSLSTAWDISSTITYEDNMEFKDGSGNEFSGNLDPVNFNSDGTKMFVMVNTNSSTSPARRIVEYDTSVTTTGYGTNETWANSTTNNELSALQQALSSQSVNRMDKTQLDAVPDANHFPTGNSLDLMVALNMASGSTAPKSDGVSINYDADALVRQATTGTDYEADFPSSTSVRIKSLAAQNLKVRVI